MDGKQPSAFTNLAYRRVKVLHVLCQETWEKRMLKMGFLGVLGSRRVD